MGKEGYFGGRSSKKGVVVGGGGGGGGDAETQAPSGCMCAVFQFFDFHPFHFPNITQQQTSFKPPSCTLEDHATVSKGIILVITTHCSSFKPPTTFFFFILIWVLCNSGAEAPRNSLESEDADAPVSSLSSKQEDFKIPVSLSDCEFFMTFSLHTLLVGFMFVYFVK